MKTFVSSLHFQLPAGAVPEWVHLVPAGTFSGVDGRGPYRLEDAQAVITESMRAGKLAIDENHAIDKAAPEGLPAPARGWVVEMEARQDGLWGRVEWTRTGRGLLEDKAYRGISPVFMSRRADGRVLKLLRASLTNDPNLTLTTLHNRETDMDLIAKLRQALGLGNDATEDALLGAVTAHAAIAAERGRIAEAAGLAADAKPADIVTHLQARLKAEPKIEAVRAALKAGGIDLDTASAEDISKHLRGGGDAAELRQTVLSLQTQVDTMSAKVATEKATAFIDAAIEAGKPIRAMRDHYIARHQKDPAAVEAEINALVSIHAGGIVRPPKPAEGQLDADEAAVAQLMGIDPKKFAESKAELENSAA